MKAWAPRLGFAECRGCATTERPHKTEGYCNRCWSRHSYRTDPIRRAKVLSQAKGRPMSPARKEAQRRWMQRNRPTMLRADLLWRFVAGKTPYPASSTIYVQIAGGLVSFVRSSHPARGYSVKCENGFVFLKSEVVAVEFMGERMIYNASLWDLLGGDRG